MTLRELLLNHDRTAIEQYAKDRARSTFLGDALLCRVLGSLNLYVDPKNYDMTPWLALDGYWESWITLAIGRAIQPGWTCVDAGAWCGYYSAMMGNLVGPAGKVIAFEPNPRHHELAKSGALANGHSWTWHRMQAVSEKIGKARFLLTDGGGSRIDTDGKTETQTADIDSIEGKIDLIKMDIEGGEERAWAGMQAAIERNPNIIIVMEWEPERYEHAEKFVDSLLAFSPLREVTVDGLTTPITKEAALLNGMRYLWLQK